MNSNSMSKQDHSVNDILTHALTTAAAKDDHMTLAHPTTQSMAPSTPGEYRPMPTIQRPGLPVQAIQGTGYPTPLSGPRFTTNRPDRSLRPCLKPGYVLRGDTIHSPNFNPTSKDRDTPEREFKPETSKSVHFPVDGVGTDPEYNEPRSQVVQSDITGSTYRPAMPSNLSSSAPVSANPAEPKNSLPYYGYDGSSPGGIQESYRPPQPPHWRHGSDGSLISRDRSSPDSRTIQVPEPSRWDVVFRSIAPISPTAARGVEPSRYAGASDRIGHGYVPMGSVHGNTVPQLPARLYELQMIGLQKKLKGISDGYGGDPFNPANQSADISDEENTALWMTNLPPNCDHKMLLSAVRDCGKIYACVVNPPTDATGGSHMTAAAKLVFFDRAGAENLLRQAHEGRFKVGGCVPRVRLNRIKSAAREPGPHCRVLHIEGPPELVNTACLHRFFAGKFTFELEDVATVYRSPQRVRQEWRFGSYRCQAEAARQSIHREKERFDLADAERALWDRVNVHFGVDPCAP
ncbi:hypothetical protein DL766_005679 [Monosporascus sp. MC13-8B]|nr:hypothetical protein DL763_006559 [Monosporascus cannonballus]RYP28848.1 hypothetical protein DL766_005679 [Monosporascus sp. MC13-8B]